MVISKATPKQVLDWFMSGRANVDILCLLLAPSRKDRDRIRELIEDSSAYDALMGRKIGFLLMYPGQGSALGLGHGSSRSVFPGEPLFRDLRDLRTELTEFQDGDFYGRIASETAAQMAHFVPDFMDLLGIGSEALPTLCVLVYGEEHFKTISLGNDWTLDELGRWLTELARVANRKEVVSVFPSFVLQQFTDMEREVATLEAGVAVRKTKIAERFDRLDRKYGLNDADRLASAHFLQAGQLSCSDLEMLLGQLSIATTPKFASDNNNVPGIRKLVGEVEGLQRRITDSFDKGTRSFESIPLLHERMKQRSAETLRQLNALRLPGAATRNLSYGLERFEKVAAYVSKAQDVFKRLAFLGPLLSRLDKMIGL